VQLSFEMTPMDRVKNMYAPASLNDVPLMLDCNPEKKAPNDFLSSY
jgi:hypothetical protein